MMRLFMKRVFLISGVCIVFVVNAMPKKVEEKKISVVFFSVNTQPKIQIIQIPSKNKVKFDDIIKNEVNIKGNTYNGLPLYADIKIRCDTPIDEIKNMIKKAVRTDEIEVRKCFMPEDDYNEMISPLVSKKKIKEKYNEILGSSAIDWLLSKFW